MLQLNLQNAAVVALLGVTTSTHRMIGAAMTNVDTIEDKLPEQSKFICKYPQEYTIKRKSTNGELYDEVIKSACPMVYNYLTDKFVCKRCGEELVYEG